MPSDYSLMFTASRHLLFPIKLIPWCSIKIRCRLGAGRESMGPWHGPLDFPRLAASRLSSDAALIHSVHPPTLSPSSLE